MKSIVKLYDNIKKFMLDNIKANIAFLVSVIFLYFLVDSYDKGMSGGGIGPSSAGLYFLGSTFIFFIYLESFFILNKKFLSGFLFFIAALTISNFMSYLGLIGVYLFIFIYVIGLYLVSITKLKYLRDFLNFLGFWFIYFTIIGFIIPFLIY